MLIIRGPDRLTLPADNMLLRAYGLKFVVRITCLYIAISRKIKKTRKEKALYILGHTNTWVSFFMPSNLACTLVAYTICFVDAGVLRISRLYRISKYIAFVFAFR